MEGIRTPRPGRIAVGAFTISITLAVAGATPAEEGTTAEEPASFGAALRDGEVRLALR